MVRFKYEREPPNEPYLLTDLNPRRPWMQEHMLKIVDHLEMINAHMSLIQMKMHTWFDVRIHATDNGRSQSSEAKNVQCVSQ
jgi:hypothetical protein